MCYIKTRTRLRSRQSPSCSRKFSFHYSSSPTSQEPSSDLFFALLLQLSASTLANIMLVMQQPHQRHGHLPLVSSSPHSLQQTYQRATPPSVTCYSEQQSSSAGLFPYNQYSSNFGLYSTSSCPHIGGSAGSYYTNSTCSPTQMDSSPIVRITLL